MAVVPGVVREVSDIRPVLGPSLHHTISSVEYEILSCIVTVDYPTGTYASADDSNFNPQTAIQNSMRNGKTVTVLQACFASSGDENGSIVGAGACAVSANVVTNPLLQEDLSTEHADGSMSATWNRPLGYCVTFRQAVE